MANIIYSLVVTQFIIENIIIHRHNYSQGSKLFWIDCDENNMAIKKCNKRCLVLFTFLT